MTIILIVIGIYVISCLGAYKFIQKMHYDEKGINAGFKPDNKDVGSMFLLVLNSLMTILYCLGLWKKPKYRKHLINPETFFKPKNHK